MPVAVPSTSSSVAAAPGITGRMLDRLPQVAEHILSSGLGTTAPAADLPADHFVEVLPAIYGCAHAFLHAVEQGREFTQDEVAALVAPVIERHAEDRLPLRTLMEAVHLSAQQVLREAVALSTPAEVGQLVEFGSRTLELLMHINLITVQGYAAVEQSIYHPVSGTVRPGTHSTRPGRCRNMLITWHFQAERLRPAPGPRYVFGSRRRVVRR